MKIFGWAANHGGCGQYRIGLPMFGLGRLGHDATAFSVLNVELPDDLDVLVGQQLAEPERAELWLELAARPDRRFALVFETDDDLWNVHETNVAGRAFRERATQERVEQCAAVADAVTVTTEPLAEVMRRFNPNVHVLPNCVDASWLDIERPRRDRLTLGWAGGSSHQVDFDSVRSELRTFLRRNPAVDTHFIGTNYGRELGRPDTRHTAWNANLVDYLHCIDFDLGIAPLAYTRFNRSKSDIKFLELAALGIPLVASDFGPYAASVQHRQTGLLVRHPHEWAKYLRELANDADLRAELGGNARRWAAERTVQGNAWRWWLVYEQAVARRAGYAAPVLTELGAGR